MPTQVTGSGLLSLVADFGSEAPKSQLVAAAGYIKPDGKLSWTAFYEALLAAKGITTAPVQRDEDEDYQELSDDLKGLYDEIHRCVGEKWNHVELMEFLGLVVELGIETADEFSSAFAFWTEDRWNWQREFIEDLIENHGGRDLTSDAGMLSWVAIDYETTWEANLRHDYTEVEYDGAVYVFSDSF
jgi:hypothetical protein